MLATTISAAALLISGLSLVVSLLGYRASGPRLTIVESRFSVKPEELWLEIRIANSGRGEITVEGATCDLLRSCATVLPHRLKGAESLTLTFREPLGASLARRSSATVTVGLGTGKVLVSQVRMTEDHIREARAVLERAATPRPSAWQPPAQEVI